MADLWERNLEKIRRVERRQRWAGECGENDEDAGGFAGDSVRVGPYEQFDFEANRDKTHKSPQEVLQDGVRQRQDHKCFFCDKTSSENGRMLAVHHIDENPEHNHPDNLMALCQACHGNLHARIRQVRPYLMLYNKILHPQLLARCKGN